MKSTRRTLIRRAIIVAASFLTIAVLVAAALIPFQPPSHWSAITPGASREAVRAIIPEFDQPWGDVKADFEYEQRGPFTWRLAVSWQDDHVHWVEKELWTSWPERRKLRSILLQ